VTRYAIVENSIVTNVIVADQPIPVADGARLVASDTANIGDTYSGTDFAETVETFSIARANTHVQQLLLGRTMVEYSWSLTGGVTVVSAMRPEDIEHIKLLSEWGTANTAATKVWVNPDGSLVTITGAQAAELYTLVSAAYLGLYDTAAVLLRSSPRNGLAAEAGIITEFNKVLPPAA
jgi:hypothetical protein